MAHMGTKESWVGRMHFYMLLNSVCSLLRHRTFLLSSTSPPSSSSTIHPRDHYSFSSSLKDTKASGTVSLGLQSICDDLLDHVVSLIRQEVVDELRLVTSTAVGPRGVPNSGVNLDTSDADSSLVGSKVANGNVQDTKGGAVLKVLVADALERQGELDVERLGPGIVGGAERGSGEVGDCIRNGSVIMALFALWQDCVPVKFVRLMPKLLRTPPQPSKIAED